MRATVGKVNDAKNAASCSAALKAKLGGSSTTGTLDLVRMSALLGGKLTADSEINKNDEDMDGEEREGEAEDEGSAEKAASGMSNAIGRMNKAMGTRLQRKYHIPVVRRDEHGKMLGRKNSRGKGPGSGFGGKAVGGRPKVMVGF
jgi:hypothetical protein